MYWLMLLPALSCLPRNLVPRKRLDLYLLTAEKLETAQVKKMVDRSWQLRLSNPDPLEALLHHDEVSCASA